MLVVSTLVLIKDSLEECHGLLLQILLHRGEVDPAADGLRVQVSRVRLEALVDDLTSFFELTIELQEGGCSYQIAVVRHFLPLVHCQHECVDSLLVDVTAAFMVENEGLGGCVLNFSAVLDPGQLSDGLIDVSFVEDSVRLPEDENGIGAFFHFLRTAQTSEIARDHSVTDKNKLTLSQRVRIEHHSFSLIR